MSSDQWEQGREYVEKLRQRGRSDDDIRKALLQAGWQEAQLGKLLPEPDLAPRTADWEEMVAEEEPAGAPQASRPAGGPPPPPRPGVSAKQRDAGSSEAMAALRARRETHGEVVRRPSDLALLVILVDLGAILMVLLGVGALFLGGAAAGGASAAAGAEGAAVAAVIGAAAMLFGIILMVIYGGILVVSHFLWKGFAWARIAMMVLVGLSVLSNLHGLMTGGEKLIPGLVLLVMVLFLIILNKQDVKAYCSR
jgi:hypothetical protein